MFHPLHPFYPFLYSMDKRKYKEKKSTNYSGHKIKVKVHFYCSKTNKRSPGSDLLNKKNLYFAQRTIGF